MPNSCKQKQYFISLTILAGMFLYSVCIMGELHPDSLFPYRLRTNPFRILLRGFCFLYSLFCHGYSFGNPPKKVGFKRGIMYGFMLTALGAFLFVPAALVRQFEIFSISIFSIGTGLAILQTAANPM